MAKATPLHTIFGTWLVRLVGRGSRCLDGNRGTCDPPDAEEPRMILIDKQLKEQEFLEVLLHETAHACFPTASEDVVHAYALQVSRLAYLYGWRKTK